MDIEFENHLRSLGQEMEYPPTPDIAGFVKTRIHRTARPRFFARRLAWSLVIVLILISSLVVIPPVRAAIVEFIQIGMVRIFPREAAPTPQFATTATPKIAISPTAALESSKPSTATPEEASPLRIPYLDQIAGETKLANALQSAPYPILLPTYPADLGQPDHVYLQDADGVMIVLVWVDPVQPERVTMSLHFIPAGHWAINKFGPVNIEPTFVNGQSAVWAEGPYPLLLRNGRLQVDRLIDGHVLIWADGELTYRLETDLPLEEAIMIAESLEPIP